VKNISHCLLMIYQMNCLHWIGFNMVGIYALNAKTRRIHGELITFADYVYTPTGDLEADTKTHKAKVGKRLKHFSLNEFPKLFIVGKFQDGAIVYKTNRAIVFKETDIKTFARVGEIKKISRSLQIIYDIK